jgi:hypothetical protein
LRLALERSASTHPDQIHLMIEDAQCEDAAVMALRRFARDIGVPEDAAMNTYRRELENLSAGAKVTGFVAIIAEKKTKDALLAGCWMSAVCANPTTDISGSDLPAVSVQRHQASGRTASREAALTA